MEKVSVIIPTYKRSDFLIRAIESVINQTYRNVEIIVVDDNGIGTEFQIENEKKLKNYIRGNKIVYLKHEKNKNGAVARNTGIKFATGEYITFLDDDDFFLKERIEILVKKINEDPGFDCVYSSMVKIKKNHIYNYRIAKKEGNLLKDILSQYSFFGTGSNMFFTKKSIEKIGLFDEKFFRFQDLEYMARFFEKEFKICAINKVLVVKCEEDNLNVPNFVKMKKAKEMFAEKFKESIQKLEYRSIMYNIFKELYIFSCGMEHLEAKNLLKKYGNIKLKDKIIYIYNKLTINNKIFNSINYIVREIRCIGKYKKEEKKEIFSLINNK